MIKGVRQLVSTRSRAKKLEEFFKLCARGSQVLDVGVSGLVSIDGQSLNHFLNNYDRDPSTYTGLGVDDMSAMRTAYPKFRFVQYDGAVMPFSDDDFDWVFSNAVIEHVGDESAQLGFINEMLRVSINVFFTTPNRWFPIETHSNQLFRHWNRNLFDRWARKNNKHWLSAARLRLLGFNDLVDLLEKSKAKEYRIIRNRSLGWPMTFSVIAS